MSLRLARLPGASRHPMAKTALRTLSYFHRALLAKAPETGQVFVAWGFVAAAFWCAAALLDGDLLPLRAALLGCLTALLAAIAAIDARWGLIPDALVLGVLAVGTVHLLDMPVAAWGPALAAAGLALGGGRLLQGGAAILMGREAFGFGDVKLVAAALLLIGPQGLLPMLVIAVASALLSVAILRSRRHPAGRDAIPFGPHLGLGLIWTLLVGSGA